MSTSSNPYRKRDIISNFNKGYGGIKTDFGLKNKSNSEKDDKNISSQTNGVMTPLYESDYSEVDKMNFSQKPPQQMDISNYSKSYDEDNILNQNKGTML